MPHFFRSPLAIIALLAFLGVTLQIGTMGYHVYRAQSKPTSQPDGMALTASSSIPFPVGVNVSSKTITEDPNFTWYVEEYLAIETTPNVNQSVAQRVWNRMSELFAESQLASVVTRTLVVYAGQRKEEVVRNFADVMSWNKEQEAAFAEQITTSIPEMSEGKFYPGRYTVPRGATPEVVAQLLLDEFSSQIMNRYDTEVELQVPLPTTLTIASLLEREAYDFTDMRIISGIIWNRLFINMPLQLDASLQYVKGSLTTESNWWPVVKPADKYLPSPFNTYQTAGLPPAPIANPSLEAIIAALNPKTTDCLFYFHDEDGTFYCTETYEEHVALLQKMYGQGQ